ncbi:bridging integrator 3 homolog [Sycon ciliatum]|uniref:bridging integrator 3 homolog n=1 Tax=Sycon ciliatum TaxID=27933 RepID=UPI0031F64DA7|eukprot:scpid58517/ scgid0307/ Bridging integrator 3 homolog
MCSAVLLCFLFPVFLMQLRTGKKDKPQDETDQIIAQFQQVEAKTKKICKDLRKHGEAMTNMAKAQHRVLSDLYQTVYGRSNNTDGPDKNRTRGPTRLIIKRVPELNTYASLQLAISEKQHEMQVRLRFDEERLMMEPLKKYSLIFPTVNSALSKRESRKQEMEKANTKVEKYKEKNSPKLDLAVAEAKKAKEDFAKVDSIVVAELPVLHAGRLEFFEACLGCYIQAQKLYYEQMAAAHEDTLSKLGYSCAGDGSPSVKEQLDTELDSLFGEMATLSVTDSTAATTGKS